MMEAVLQSALLSLLEWPALAPAEKTGVGSAVKRLAATIGRRRFTHAAD
jgi:hypothetical protein